MVNTSKGLREMLAQRPCFGTFLKLARPEIVDVLALAGFDFVVCDMEHAQMAEQEARCVVRACVAAGLPVVVRLPDLSQGLVNRLLEAGATGVQLPRLRAAQDTRQLYSMMHFPPLGTRSVGNANQLAGYGTVPILDYLEMANAKVLTVGQFETRDIDQPCDPMFEGLDVAFIGPTDLSVDFGVAGQADAPDVRARIAEIEAAAKRTGTVMGAFVSSVDAARRCLEAGYRYIAASGDVTLLSKGANGLVAELEKLREQLAPAASSSKATAAVAAGAEEA